MKAMRWVRRTTAKFARHDARLPWKRVGRERERYSYLGPYCQSFLDGYSTKMLMTELVVRAAQVVLFLLATPVRLVRRREVRAGIEFIRREVRTVRMQKIAVAQPHLSHRQLTELVAQL